MDFGSTEERRSHALFRIPRSLVRTAQAGESLHRISALGLSPTEKALVMPQQNYIIRHDSIAQGNRRRNCQLRTHFLFWDAIDCLGSNGSDMEFL
jgi:hypothetical protein